MTDWALCRRLTCQVAAQAVLAGCMALALHSAGAQSTEAQALTPPVATLEAPPAPVSRAWQQLTPLQKQALAPLGAQWSALSAQQQNKWLALSRNFLQLSVAEQVTMHSRMADWVDLSPQKRNLARLNFNQLQNLPKEDKKAKWEAYQALSSEEKKVLSAGSAPTPKSAAPTAKPLDNRRLVQPTVRAATTEQAGQPALIDRKTLLPRPAAPPAAEVPDSERQNKDNTAS